MKKVVMTAAAVVAAVGLGGVTVAEAKTWDADGARRVPHIQECTVQAARSILPRLGV